VSISFFLSFVLHKPSTLNQNQIQMIYRFYSLIKPCAPLNFVVFWLLLFSANPSYSWDTDKDFFLHGDFIYKNNIRTVLFNQLGFELSDPLIRMNSDDRLILRFDDMDADYKHYNYTIIHCDAHWQPSELRPFEYIDGFYEDHIRDHRRSMNTRVPYTHYWLEFPNSNMRPTKSGNYLLIVFKQGNPDDIVLTRRFSVFTQSVSVSGHVQQANLVRYRDRKQQILFDINLGRYRVSNPYRDLKVVITQNGRWDNAITDLAPRGIRGDQLIYDYEEETLFEGNNEFRRFDIRSLRFLSERVHDIRSSRRYWDVYLVPDRLRAHARYVTDDDLNGRFHISTRDAPNDMTEADYAWVHFHLPMPGGPLEYGHLYVMGALTDWVFTEDNKMNYNYGEKAYELSLLLKQGYYNYMYAFIPVEGAAVDIAFIEGSHSVTENDYTVYVYHRQPGDLYDRLIGVGHFNSAVPR